MAEKLNQLQRRELLTRLERVRKPAFKREPEPANVKAARKVVEDWDQKQRRADTKSWAAWRKRCKEVREAIVFGDAAAALAAVKKIEALEEVGNG